MAAHDDKISDNRRRLFKALSAAPVVMTLRPGSALANASAYQCAANIPDPTTLSYGTETVPVCEGEGCYAYQPRPYWDVSGCGYPTVPQIVVETQPGTYVTGSGDIVTVTRDGDDLLGFVVSATDTYTCDPAISRQDGLFLLVGQTTPIGGDPTFFSYQGVYPEKRLGTAGLQGITGTCLNSIPNNIVGAFTIAKG